MHSVTRFTFPWMWRAKTRHRLTSSDWVREQQTHRLQFWLSFIRKTLAMRNRFRHHFSKSIVIIHRLIHLYRLFYTHSKQTNNSFVKCFAVKIIMRIKQPFERRLFVISILSFSLTREPNTILFHLILLGNFDLYAPLVRQTRWFCNRIRLSQSEMKKCCSFFRSRIRTKAVIRKQGKLMATTSFDDDKPVREIKGWKYMKWKKYSNIWRADEWDFDVLMGTGMTWRNVTNEIEQVDFL